MKEYISSIIKKTVWDQQSLIHFPYISQCYTCSEFCRVPQSIRHYYQLPFNFEYLNLRLAHFSHIISEYNGGKAVTDNLVIQCYECNTSLGSFNITESMVADIIMIDDDIINEIFYVNEPMDLYIPGHCETKCCYKIFNNYCNNNRMKNCSYCHIHNY